MVPFYTGEESYVEFKIGSRTFLGWAKLPPYMYVIPFATHTYVLRSCEIKKH